MSDKMLITYASRAGSTAEVAEVVAESLRKQGNEVDVQAVEKVKDLAPYRAVVVGSAIQNRQWLPEAVQFVQAHRSTLNQKTVAMFTLCMTLAMKNGEKFRPDILEWISPVRRLVRPVSEGLFPGVLNIAKISSPGDRSKFRLSVLFGVWSEGDHRDWDVIHTWVEKLASKLGQSR